MDGSFDGMCLIPPGSRIIQIEDRVVIWFPTENDAIMFREILRAIEKTGKVGEPIPVRLCLKEPETKPKGKL